MGKILCKIVADPLIPVSLFRFLGLWDFSQLFAIHFPSPPLSRFFFLPLYVFIVFAPAAHLSLLPASPPHAGCFSRCMTQSPPLSSLLRSSYHVHTCTDFQSFIMKNSPAQTRDKHYSERKTESHSFVSQRASAMTRRGTTLQFAFDVNYILPLKKLLLRRLFSLPFTN